MAKTFNLLMQLGPTQGEKKSLKGGQFVVGREPTCDWVIDDVEVSRRHARFIAQDNGFAIEDLGSTNGTFVDGQRIRTVVPLKPGAAIRLGENVLLYYDAAGESTPTPAPKAEAEPPQESAEAAPQAPAAPPVELLETAPPAEEKAAEPPEDMAPAMPSESDGQNAVEELPFYRRPVVMVAGAVLILGACALAAFLWYVDANYLWCDVFGGLIPACAAP